MRTRNEPRRRRALRAACLLCAALLLLSAPAHARADGGERRTVRVAFFPMSGYHDVRADGSLDGVDVRYLAEVRSYTGWELEYVPCDSWEDALEKLSLHQVDLVGSAQYSAARAEKFLYADLSSGYTFGVIATDPSGRIAYEDFQAMRELTYGMVTGYIRRDEFYSFLADNGIRSPVVREYPDTAALQQALKSGEIDALVHTFTEIEPGQRLIGRFAPSPFYYMTYPGNEELMRQLDQAIADLKMNRPELEAELMNEFYYDRFDKMVLLTTREKEYLAGAGELAVGYLDGYYPFSYEEDGTFKGLSRDMLEAAFAVTGVSLRYERMPDEQAARQALQDGRIDMIAYSTDAEEDLSACSLKIARSYAEMPLVLVMPQRGMIGDISTIAATPALAGYALSSSGFEHASVVDAATQVDCLSQVVSGNADAAVCNGYLAEYLFRTQIKYEDLQIKLVLGSRLPAAVVVRQDDTLLSEILVKTTADIDPGTINEFMMRENTYPLISVRNYIKDHSVAIILFLVLVILAIVGISIRIIWNEYRVRRLMYKDTSMDIWNLNYLLYHGTRRLLPQKRRYAVAYITMPQFRRFNTIYGWSAGDRLLHTVAEELKSATDGRTEICARDRSDHFVLLLCLTAPDQYRDRLKAVKDRLDETISRQAGARMSVHVGARILPEGSEDLKAAIGAAEQALEFIDPHVGIMLYDEDTEKALKQRHDMEELLEAADPQKDFVTYYQPKVDIFTGQVVGAEALVRFLDPTQGGRVTPPGFFVPYYEQTGKITEIDFFVFECSCRLLRRRLDAGENVVPISCNFSRMHFLKPDFADRFDEVVRRYQIPRELIEMEITETMVLEELERGMVIRTLRTLESRQVRLSIDDFGSGYSSLGVFEQIPASVVKLDRSFLLNHTDRDRQVSIMRGIAMLAAELKAQVVCEGVETEEDVELMKEIGARVAQGYYYSQPIPEDRFEQELDQCRRPS